jgi:GGDEF domain-containing protein
LYGFSSGDRTIKLTADIIMDSVFKFWSSCDFVGHVGGDDFIVITAPINSEPICDNIVRVFNEKILSLYSPEDRARGFITTSSSRGRLLNILYGYFPGYCFNEFRNLTSHIQFMEVAVELKKKAKTIAEVFILRQAKVVSVNKSMKCILHNHLLEMNYVQKH